MLFIVLGIAYILLLALLVRFFQAVHRWDEEIYSMEVRENMRTEKTAKPKAA